MDSILFILSYIEADYIEDNNKDNNEEDNKQGCSHNKTKCKIVSPCCNYLFWCKECHDEYHILHNTNDKHDLNRYDIKEIVCIECNNRQNISNQCNKCNIYFAEYFCKVCMSYNNKPCKYHK